MADSAKASRNVLTDQQRLILRDCYGALRLSGRSLSLLEDDLGDVILGLRRKDAEQVRAELEQLADEVSACAERLQKLRERFQALTLV